VPFSQEVAGKPEPLSDRVPLPTVGQVQAREALAVPAVMRFELDETAEVANRRADVPRIAGKLRVIGRCRTHRGSA
jgi:hypothetical protein